MFCCSVYTSLSWIAAVRQHSAKPTINNSASLSPGGRLVATFVVCVIPTIAVLTH